MSRLNSIRACVAGPKSGRGSDAALALIAKRFALLSDPLRLRLVHLLFAGEMNVRSLVERSGGTQGNVSRQLQALTAAGVLARRRDGLQVFYIVADPAVHRLCDLVCGSIAKQLARQAGVFVSVVQDHS